MYYTVICTCSFPVQYYNNIIIMMMITTMMTIVSSWNGSRKCVSSCMLYTRIVHALNRLTARATTSTPPLDFKTGKCDYTLYITCICAGTRYYTIQGRLVSNWNIREETLNVSVDIICMILHFKQSNHAYAHSQDYLVPYVFFHVEKLTFG